MVALNCCAPSDGCAARWASPFSAVIGATGSATSNASASDTEFTAWLMSIPFRSRRRLALRRCRSVLSIANARASAMVVLSPCARRKAILTVGDSPTETASRAAHHAQLVGAAEPCAPSDSASITQVWNAPSVANARTSGMVVPSLCAR
jgi:hypothetical protein